MKDGREWLSAIVIGLALLLPLVFCPWFYDASFLAVKDSALVIGAAALCMVLLVSRLWGGRARVDDLNIVLPVVLFCVVATLSAIVGGHDTHWRDTARALSCAAVFLACCSSAYPRGAHGAALRIACVSGTVAAIYGIVQFFGYDVFVDLPGTNYGGEVRSSMGNANTLAGYLAAVVPLTLAMASVRHRTISRTFYGLCAVTQLVCLAMTASRAGWLACGISLLLFWFLKKPSRPLQMVRSALCWAAVVALAGFLISSAVPDIPLRVREAIHLKVESRNVQRKLLHWRAAEEMAMAHPLAGLGLGAFKVDFLEYQARLLEGDGGKELMGSWDNTEWAHNEYLQLAAELGLLGVIPVLWFLVSLVARAFREIQAREAAGAAACCVAILVDAVFDFPLHVGSTAFLFVLSAAALVPKPYPPRHAAPAPRHTIRWLATGAAVVVFARLVLFLVPPLASSYCQHRAAMRMGDGGPSANWVKAAALLDKAATFDPGNGMAQAQLGRACLHVGMPGRAVTELTRSLKTFVNPDTYANLGCAWDMLGNSAESVRWYRRACRIDPLSTEYKRNLALSCVKAGLRTEGIRYFHEMIDVQERILLGHPLLPQDSRLSMRREIAAAYLGIGLACEAENRIGDAEDAYRRATSVCPEDADAGLNLGLLYMRSGEYGKAVALYQAMLTSQHGAPQVKFNLARAYAAAGDLVPAAALFDEIIAECERTPLANVARRERAALKEKLKK